MEIFIIRHAIAMDREEFKLQNSNDSQRPLSELGIRRFKKIATALKSLIGEADVIITSPLVRAKQTTKLLAVHFPKTEIVSSLALTPLANPNEFAKWCKEHLKKKTKKIIVVGHEPHLSIFASWLLFGIYQSKIKIKKGGCLSISVEDSIRPESGTLNWALTPKSIGVK